MFFIMNFYSGLGDTNYSNFCNCGKVLDRRFEELGASRFYPSAWADDAVGYVFIVHLGSFSLS